MNQPATKPTDSFARIISTSVTSRTCPQDRKLGFADIVAQLADPHSLSALLKEAADAHHKFEEETGKPDANWPDWYALYILNTLNPQQKMLKMPALQPNQKIA